MELVQLPWGLSPSRPKARAVINLRSEGRGFTRGRCLVPASHGSAPIGAEPSSEAVMAASGSEPQHEAAELIRGIQAIVAERRG